MKLKVGRISERNETMSNFLGQTHKMKTQRGFIAAFDQSGGSTRHALRLHGVKDDA